MRLYPDFSFDVGTLLQEWTDYNLQWNESEYGGVKDLRITPHRLWKPDILMYNSADEGFDGTYQTNVVVTYNGSCLYVPPGIFKSTCKIDITWFPFDDQHCDMKFGSWTYDGNQRLDTPLAEKLGGRAKDLGEMPRELITSKALRLYEVENVEEDTPFPRLRWSTVYV
ncbi:hypothetical protein KM043_003437 [Ampulex compressa]|nr:hypothetical protein KM043_003437 [Ampulex compressa]